MKYIYFIILLVKTLLKTFFKLIKFNENNISFFSLNVLNKLRVF